MSDSQPAAAIYFLQKKCLTNLDKIIENFSDGQQMVEIIMSPKIDMAKCQQLLTEIHNYFGDFQKNFLPLKADLIQFDPQKTVFANCKIVRVKNREIFQMIKSFIHHPNLNKTQNLLHLAKLTDDLIECITVYVDML